jgi:hypothetical protein
MKNVTLTNRTSLGLNSVVSNLTRVKPANFNSSVDKIKKLVMSPSGSLCLLEDMRNPNA